MNQAISKTHAKAVEAVRKQQGLGRLLLLARENFFVRMEHATAHLFDAGTLRICSPLLPFIDVTGTRSTEVARRMGVSKQAVGRKITALVERGFVECVSDPADGRAFLINFTPVGMKFLTDVLAAIRRVERDLERELGAERLRVMHEVLFEMANGRKSDEPGDVPALQAKAPAAPRASGSKRAVASPRRT